MVHGQRGTYARGCRCDACRAANTAYERARAVARATGEWNGLVPAEVAQQHLLKLSEAGVGRRAVAAATDIAESILFAIRSGTKQKIRAATARKILAVDLSCAGDHALMCAKPSMKLVAKLLKAGFTKTRIAQEMGYKVHALQLKDGLITVRNAARLALVHDRLMASDDMLVPSAPTQRLIRALRDELYSEKQLARWLEMPDEVLHIPSKRLPRSLAKKVAALHLKLTQ